MTRITFPTDETYTEDQRRVADIAMKSARGVVAGPLHAMLLAPTLGEHSHLMGAYLNYRSTLDRKLVELAIITAAHLAKSAYAWKTHGPRAVEYGISQAIVDAIGTDRKPEFTDAVEALVYEITVTLCKSFALDDTLFERGKKQFGERGMVELVALVGFYGMVAMTLNVFGTRTFPHKG